MFKDVIYMFNVWIYINQDVILMVGIRGWHEKGFLSCCERNPWGNMLGCCGCPERILFLWSD